MKADSFVINSRKISDEYPPYIIAEISANHNGSIVRAKETILAARNAEVDAVKIQTYTPDTMTIDVNEPDFLINNGLWKGRSLYDLYSEAYTPFEWHKELFSYAQEIGVTLFSSPFDETAVDLLDSLDAPGFKVASFEVVDLPLIKYIAQKKKPILMSTGMASCEEIGEAIEVVKSVGNDNVLLFHCISSYPAPLSEANLNMIPILQREFSVQVGLSDHTIGNLASVLATAMGAFRRSLYFVRDVEEGEVITKDSVRRIRPGFGLEAKYYDIVIGSECLISAKRGDRVTLKHFGMRRS